MSDYEIEVHRRVYRNRDGAYLSVAPDPDGLRLVEVKQFDPHEVGRLVMHPAEARLLANALLACADEMESTND